MITNNNKNSNFNFRDLREDEIDVRVSSINSSFVNLLLYKNARVDMNILDETVGPENWQREHSTVGDNVTCTIRVWDPDKNQWIAKQDVGTESFSEATKGAFSDSFKRAAFCLGIGRELYTAPQIKVEAKDVNIREKNGKPVTYDHFVVANIAIREKKIVGLVIVNENTGKVVFKYIDEEAAAKEAKELAKAAAAAAEAAAKKAAKAEVGHDNNI